MHICRLHMYRVGLHMGDWVYIMYRLKLLHFEASCTLAIDGFKRVFLTCGKLNP